MAMVGPIWICGQSEDGLYVTLRWTNATVNDRLEKGQTKQCKLNSRQRRSKRRLENFLDAKRRPNEGRQYNRYLNHDHDGQPEESKNDGRSFSATIREEDKGETLHISDVALINDNVQLYENEPIAQKINKPLMEGEGSTLDAMFFFIKP